MRITKRTATFISKKIEIIDTVQTKITELYNTCLMDDNLNSLLVIPEQKNEELINVSDKIFDK